LPNWQEHGEAQFACGGVGDENMAALKAMRSEANASLLFTAGTRGAYVADVNLTIQGNNVAQPIALQASGPACLLKLPKGKYELVAEYKGREMRRQVVIGSKLAQASFRWPENDANEILAEGSAK